MPATATDRLYGLTTSVAVKSPCRVATTANITLSGLQTIDGVTVAADDRVLVKDQTDATANGIYYADTSSWTRTPDFDGSLDAVDGTLVIVREGTTWARTVWELTTADPVVIGTSALTFEQALLQDLATSSFVQAGTGAITRTGQDKERDFISVLDYVAREDVDGTTSNQTGIAAAVAHAYANGLDLYWPHPGAKYVSTATIPNFHSVRHFGPGQILRGSDTFYVDPTSTQANTLYVTATGSASNDGLSASEPMDSPATAFGKLPNYGPVLKGTWTVSAGAGTWTGQVELTVKSENYVKLVGPAWVTAPTAILNGASTSANMISADGGGLFLWVENFHAKDCTDNVAQAMNGAEIYIKACHLTGGGKSTSSGSCLYVANQSRGYVNGLCLLDDCDSSEGVLTAYGGSIISVGQDGTTSADSPTISNSGGSRCVSAQHGSLVKLRRAYLSGGTYGVYSDSASHVSHEAGEANSHTYVYFTNGGATILMNESSVTHTGHTALRFAARSDAVRDRPIPTDDSTWVRTHLYASSELTNSSITGATSNILTTALTLRDKDFNVKGRAIRAVIYGNKTGTAGAVTLTMSGSVGGAIRSITWLNTDVGDFRAEITTTCMSTAGTTVDVFTEAVVMFDATNSQYVNATGTDALNVAQDISLSATVAAGDVLTIRAVEIYQAGV